MDRTVVIKMTVRVAFDGADELAEAQQLIELAATQGTVLRLVGGVAILARCPSVRQGVLRRAYADVDFVTAGGKALRHLDELFRRVGWQPIEHFNSLHGAYRRLYQPQAGKTTTIKMLDLFVGTFKLCHEIPVANRLELEFMTLPLAELFLTKAQVVKLTAKDAKDMLGLLLDHPIGDEDGETVNQDVVTGICRRDWGLWRTVMGNLDALLKLAESFGLEEPQKRQIDSRIGDLKAGLEAVPKSTRWRLRALIGERVRWYDEPEDALDRVGG